MKKRLTSLVITTVFYCWSYATCFAWGLTGHRVVAEIANNHLTKRAKKNIQRILGNESLAMAANWPDFIKSDPAYQYLNSWHYINFKSGLTLDEVRQQLQQDTATNAYNKLLWLKEQLLQPNTLSHDKQVLYLRLLIHLVGDMHQPMHTGRPQDLGGNRLKLYWFNQPTNLHRLWDEQLIDFQQLSYTEYTQAIDFVTRKQLQLWQKEPIANWLCESYEITESLYLGVKPNARLSYRYNFDHIAILNLQLLKGGIRLAGVLNEVFG